MRDQRLLATFRDFRDALFASDVETMDRILAPEYRGYSIRGQLDPVR